MNYPKTTSNTRLIIIALSVLGAMFLTPAQAQYDKVNTKYFGIGAAMGIQQQQITSNYAEIDNMNLQQEGGSILVTKGNQYFRVKVEGGYYASADVVPQTVDMYRAAIKMDFHPLELINPSATRFSPYVSGGLGKSFYKFHGYFAENENKPKNYSASLAPYLGQIQVVRGSATLGIEYQVMHENHFLHFFAEYQKGFSLDFNRSQALAATSVSGTNAFSVGLYFGCTK